MITTKNYLPVYSQTYRFTSRVHIYHGESISLDEVGGFSSLNYNSTGLLHT